MLARMSQNLLTPAEVDAILRYPFGKSKRLARKGRLPHILLPDGSIRFARRDIEAFLNDCTAGVTAKANIKAEVGVDV